MMSAAKVHKIYGGLEESPPRKLLFTNGGSDIASEKHLWPQMKVESAALYSTLIDYTVYTHYYI